MGGIDVKRPVVLLALLLGLLPGLPAHALPGVFEVSGARGASATFVTSTRTVFRLSHAVVEAQGRFGGIALYDSTGASRGTVFVHDSVHQVVVSGEEVDLAPGRYHVVLLADAGPVRVRVPLLVGTGLSVEATAPNAQQFRSGTIPLPADDTRASLRFPLSPPSPGKRSITVAVVEPAYSSRPYSIGVCAARRGRTCAPGDTGARLTGEAGGRRLMTGFTVPGRFVPGQRDAYVEVDFAARVPTTLRAYVVEFREPVRR